MAVLAVLVSAVPGAAGPDFAVMRVADRAEVPVERLGPELAPARALFLGEVHDVAEHHRIQLTIIEGLHAAGVPLAVGLEMFRAEHQASLDRWIAGRMSEREFRRLYAENWTLPWQLYRELFLFARDHRIPLVGLNVPDEIVTKVARNGFASLTDRELGRLPKGISCTVDDAYLDFIRRSHGQPGHDGQTFRFFCEAQMVWDRAMASNLAAYLVAHDGMTVAILAGNGHAWRRGIPAQLRMMAPNIPSAVVLPIVKSRITRDAVTTEDADYVVF